MSVLAFTSCGLYVPFEGLADDDCAAGRTLQIFDIEAKQKVKSHVNDADVIFWKWISDSTLGMVTDTAVYHWSVADTTSPPQKIFDRHPTLVGAQIINYKASADEKWLCLVGTSGNTTNPSAVKVKGAMQLYSRDRGVSHVQCDKPARPARG